MFEFVVGGHFLVVNCERASLYTTFIFLGGMGTKFPREHVQDPLPYPPTLRERCEREVVWIHLSQACKRKAVTEKKVLPRDRNTKNIALTHSFAILAKKMDPVELL